MTVDPSALKMLAQNAMLAGAMAQDVPSPCVSVCRLDASNAHCEGCLRSLQEIGAWRTSSDAEKRAIWGRIAQRAASLSAATAATTVTPS